MRMKKYFIIILLVTYSTISFGRQYYKDIVYLNNSNIIRCILPEQVPDISYKIETFDRNVFVYQTDEIERLIKETKKGSDNSASKSTGLKKGYQGIVEIGYALGVGDYEGLDFLKLNIINGYQLNPYFSLGIGTGLRYYYDADSYQIPLFADFRANFINRKVSPYLAVGIGYTFDVTAGFESIGLLLNPSAGVSFKISNKSSLNVGFGYDMQMYDGFNSSSGAISFNVGISF